jgi:hypothetical protein
MDRYIERLKQQLAEALAKGDRAAATMLNARIDKAKAGR